MNRDNRLARALDPALMRLGHYGTHLLLIAVGGAIVNDFLGRNVAAVEWPVAAIWLAWNAALVADLTHHQRRLCERCIEAAPTLDPGSAVKRWRPALRAFHDRRATIISLAAILAWFFYADTVKHERPWQYAADALAVSVLAVRCVIDHQHRRLYPWCPFCRWDEGGSEEAAPVLPVVPEFR